MAEKAVTTVVIVTVVVPEEVEEAVYENVELVLSVDHEALTM